MRIPIPPRPRICGKSIAALSPFVNHFWYDVAMPPIEKKRTSLFKLDMMRFGFFGLAVMAFTFFMGSVLQDEIPSLAAETFFVNSANDIDDGMCDASHCSLREAIREANLKINGEGMDRIYFEIEGVAPHTIELSKPLPIITDPVVIDATTNPDFTNEPVVALSGGQALLDGIVITAGESVIQGFVIRDFRGSGILLAGYGGNRVLDNHLCTDATGSRAASNMIGVEIDDSPGNIVGGKTADTRNLIAGCLQVAISIHGERANDNIIAGNDIGGNGHWSLPSLVILVEESTGTVIGGNTTGERNTLVGSQAITLTGAAETTTDVRENNMLAP